MVRSLRSYVLLSVVVGILAPITYAQSIDVPKVINDALQSAGQVRKHRQVTRTVKDCDYYCCRRCEADCWRCRDKQVQQTEEFREPLRATSTQIVRVLNLEFGKPVVNALPEAIRQQTFSTRNCSSIQQTSSTTLSITVSTSNSISVSRALTNTDSVSANLGFNLGGIGSAGANVSVSRSFSLTTTDAQSQNNSYGVTETVNQMVQPKTELWGQLRAVESNLSVPFVARVIVDGTVDGNLDGYSKISQVLSEAQRTITTDGFLAVTAASDAKKALYERPLTTADCAQQPPVRTEMFAGSANLLGVSKDATPVMLTAENGPFVSSIASLEKFTTRLKEIATTFPVAPSFKSSSTAGTEGGSAERIDRSQLQEGDRLSNTPNFAAAGTHQCQSATDIGHSCTVSDIGFNDCNEAAIKLRMNDCCPSTKICSVDPATGQFKCRYGGTSISFTVSYCIPF